MLVNCPECQKQVSTSATQCPHCGAPVSSGPPMAKPVNPGYPQQPQPGYPQQAGYPQPGFAPGAPQQPPPPQSHCLRNCLILGCILTLLAIVAVVAVPVYMVKKLASSFTQDPVAATALGQKVAPGATPPAGYEPKFGIDFNMFGQKIQGTFISSGKGQDINPNADTIIAWGALNQKKSSHELQDSFQQALAAKKGQPNDPNAPKEKVDSTEEVEFTIAGQPTKVLHMVATDQQSGKKLSYYFVVLDGWNNEFGWLGVGAVGPDDKFDLEGFKAFLASLKK